MGPCFCQPVPYILRCDVAYRFSSSGLVIAPSMNSIEALEHCLPINSTLVGDRVVDRPHEAAFTLSHPAEFT